MPGAYVISGACFYAARGVCLCIRCDSWSAVDFGDCWDEFGTVALCAIGWSHMPLYLLVSAIMLIRVSMIACLHVGGFLFGVQV